LSARAPREARYAVQRALSSVSHARRCAPDGEDLFVQNRRRVPIVTLARCLRHVVQRVETLRLVRRFSEPFERVVVAFARCIEPSASLIEHAELE
jgi:hypothetical protein